MTYWKNSTSVILAARNSGKSGFKAAKNNYDYSILFLKRHQNSSFMPGAFVFPGGMMELADMDLKWKKLYSSFGFDDESYQSLVPRTKSRPAIFCGNRDELPREVSLRISAIRETFEECGLLLCKSKRDEDKVQWGKHYALKETDIRAWQSKVQASAEHFYSMCKQFQCYPDLWCLHEWNNWMTPTSKGKRFDTVFFITGMDNIPETHHGVDEVECLKWETPLNILQNDSFLPPPQVYETTRMTKYHTLDDLIEFAAKRSPLGIHLHLPVVSQMKDGLIFVLPGDSEYPKDVSKTERQILDNSGTTISEFRRISPVLNRIEMGNEMNKMVIVSNYKSEDGHLNPNSNTILSSKSNL